MKTAIYTHNVLGVQRSVSVEYLGTARDGRARIITASGERKVPAAEISDIYEII